MTNPIRRGFHTELANMFANDIRFKRSNYYYFLGKIEPWGVNDDLLPVYTAPDSDSENDGVRANSLFVKKISPNDISEVSIKYEWSAGIVYSKWDHTKDMSLLNFYVVTPENCVYKCLDNNGGIVSTVKPTGTSFSTLRTADGYLWKYMYTVPAFKRTRFSSLIHLPVQRALSDSFYNKGAINDVIVGAAGSGYPDVQLTTIVVTGTTTGSGATGRITVGVGGVITGAVITNGGSGYTAGVDLTITSVSGIKGVIRAVIVSGVITGVIIDTPGVSYLANDAIVFSLGGAVLIPLISRVTGSIESIKIIKSGAGYISAPTLSVVGAGGTGKYGNSTALTTSVIFQGRIVQVNIVDPGLNYPSDNDTTIVVQGDGTGAIFTPIIFQGSLIGVVVENPGIGYTTVGLTVSGSGTGALITPVFAPSDFVSDQSIVEQTTILGAIYAIEPVVLGNGYTITTQVTVVGDGTGCTVIPIIINGGITKYQINNFGSGYTYANIVATDINRSVIGSTDASSYAILPPRGGHGKDAVYELFGNTIVINSSMRQEKFLGSIVQDYRQFGIIKNPKNVLTGEPLTGDSYLITYKVQLNNTISLVSDQVLTLDNGTKFRVVYIDTENKVFLQQLGRKNTPPIGTLSADSVGGNTPLIYVSSSVISFPVMDKYSGSLLYVSNEAPFSLTESQGIVIKTFLKF